MLFFLNCYGPIAHTAMSHLARQMAISGICVCIHACHVGYVICCAQLHSPLWDMWLGSWLRDDNLEVALTWHPAASYIPVYLCISLYPCVSLSIPVARTRPHNMCRWSQLMWYVHAVDSDTWQATCVKLSFTLSRVYLHVLTGLCLLSSSSKCSNHYITDQHLLRPPTNSDLDISSHCY